MKSLFEKISHHNSPLTVNQIEKLQYEYVYTERGEKLFISRVRPVNIFFRWGTYVFRVPRIHIQMGIRQFYRKPPPP